MYIRPTKVLPQEREQLGVWTRELAGAEFFLIDIQDDSLVVFTPSDDPSERANRILAIFGVGIDDKLSHLSWIGANATYMPMFRFNLVDEDERLYSVDRWCYRGSIDDWIPLSPGKTLEKQARAYLPHLIKEPFYDLM